MKVTFLPGFSSLANPIPAAASKKLLAKNSILFSKYANGCFWQLWYFRIICRQVNPLQLHRIYFWLCLAIRNCTTSPTEMQNPYRFLDWNRGLTRYSISLRCGPRPMRCNHLDGCVNCWCAWLLLLEVRFSNHQIPSKGSTPNYFHQQDRNDIREM